MKTTRRQRITRVIEILGLALLGLDVVLYFAAYRPLGSLAARGQEQLSNARRKTRNEEVRVGQLEKFRDALPGADKRIEEFEKEYAPPRRTGFSRAAHLIRQVSQDSGVQLITVAYRLDTEHKEPLERLGLDINVNGSFPNLLRFAHGMETSKDFILIRRFDFAPGNEDLLSLRLVADLYLTP